MNSNDHILDNLDPEISDTLLSRRNVMKALGAGLALASVPLTFASLSRTAFAQGGPAEVIDTLNFALKLEYMESEFYTRGMAAQGLINSSDLPVFKRIMENENAHVSFISQTIVSLGGTPIQKPAFDYTAHGLLPDPFQPQNYEVFKAMAQSFEETGVRAYKGQAANLMSNKTVLTAALRIHSIEGRHVAELRRLRGQKGWITGNAFDAGIPAQAGTLVYMGEESTLQANVDIAGLAGVSGTLGTNAATEAFDEPLTRAQVETIASLFLA